MARTLIIDLTQDLDTIWKNIKKTRRADIRQAEKLGIKIEINTHIEEWYSLYLFHVEENHMHKVELSYIKKCIQSFALLFVATFNDKVLAGEMCYVLDDCRRLRTELAASKRFDSDKKISAFAHALLIWEAIKYAKEHEFKMYDFGGYQPQEPETRANSFWKQRFGGKITNQKPYSYELLP